MLGPDLEIREWNPEAERLFGVSRDRALGEDYVERFIPAEAREGVRDTLREAMAGDGVHGFESPVLGKGDDRRTVSWSFSPIQHADAGAASLVAVGNDVTERKRAMEALRLNHARWQALGEALSVGVVLLGRGHHILLANSAAQHMLRTLDPSSTGGGMLKRLGSVDLDEILDQHRDQRPIEIQIGERRQRIFEVKPNPVIGGGGGEWVLALSEVTGERETERKLWLRERLAAVGQLAAGIAHDFNNLLQSITLAAEMSRDEAADNPDLEENLDVVLLQAKRAAELVRQILDFARQSPNQPQVLDLGPFIEEAVSLLRRTLPEPVRWQVDVAPGSFVLGDPAQLQQLLANLAVNASAVMPEGGKIAIALGERSFERDEDKPFEMMGRGPWLTLTVSDTGCGMPAEILERIFEPFFSTKDRAQGAGLGLAQVYGIVKQQGGFIDVASEPGEGTRFVIYFPPAEAEVREESAEFPEIEIPSGDGAQVLLVEDDPSILRGARMALISFGYQVLAAADGEAALELYAQNRDEITLVLSDVVMPGIGGVELLEKLEERGSQAAVLLMSCYAPRSLDERSTPEGVECLQKPFSLEELAEAITRALREKLEQTGRLPVPGDGGSHAAAETLTLQHRIRRRGHGP